MPRITIIGAGMAGLLAANMLRRHQPLVIERQPSLPNNHHAVLRFRSEEVSRQLHIPFRKVRVFKSCDEADPVKAAIQYADKVTGRYEVRSLIDLSPVDRFIAPPDLVDQMADSVNISLNHVVDFSDPFDGPVISTIPMHQLMECLDYPGQRPEFLSVPGWTVTAPIRDCDMFVTRYLSRSTCLPYRISITGDQLIVEGAGELEPGLRINPTILAEKAAYELGIRITMIGEAVAHESRYAKIGRLSAEDRRRASDFMLWATTNHDVYSLGRFATWRAGLLLDDLVQDILKIERWMSGSTYDIKRSI